MNLQPFAGGPPNGAVLNARGTPLYGGKEAPPIVVGTYTGTGSARTIQVGLQPDFVMVKGNSAGRNWVQNDRNIVPTTANAHARLFPQASYITASAPVSGFTSNGFTVGTSGDANTLGETYTYYAFKFRRGFLNTTAYTGNGSNPRNVAHNLGVAPNVMMLKSLSDTTTWIWNMFLDAGTMGAGPGFRIPSSNGIGSADATWLNNTAPTASVFTVGAAITNTNTHYIACWQWASDGKNSKHGFFVGDGAANGPTITLPFRPRLIILKRMFTVLSSWALFDAANNPTSPWTKWHDWTGSSALQTDANGIIVSGRTFRAPLSYNANTAGIAYMAFG